MPQTASREAGIGLVEALVALLVVSLATVLTARLQTHLRHEGDTAQQRAEAAQWAQAELEAQRTAPSAVAAREVDTREVASGSGDGTRFHIAHRSMPLPGLTARRVEVDIDWLDRRGTARHLGLGSIVAEADPAHSGALGLARGGTSVGAIGRSTRIPLRAVDLGDGRSAFKPLETGRIAIVFDNLDGSVSAHCASVAPGLATADLRADLLGPCVSLGGRLLSGVVRFAGATPPGPARAFDTPLPFDMHLELGRGKYHVAPVCATEAVVTTGPDRHAAYHCVVFPRADGQWSGRLDLVAKGWVIGQAPGTRRVCRYVQDLDGNGTIDANLEHPAAYEAVAGSLANQNFLVLPAEEACPNAPATRPTDDNPQPSAFPATAPHQP